MSFLTILETILLGPLKLIFEIIFNVSQSFIGHPGLAIIMLSLIMNILILPLYRRADAMQEEARDRDAKLHKGVTHIKKTFSGDEKMMILQTYYRQNDYKPTSALNGSVSLLLEIPFFMAAYQFLSNLEILNGVSLGPITDLGAPDGLLVIGGITLNFLPILMTLINVISSALYLKGFPLKTKIQLYAMALFFLVFLYNSPSCLVFYWTLNNVFSLVKTIFYKLKNPRKILKILTTAAGIFFLLAGAGLYHTDSVRRKVFLVGIGILLLVPLVTPLLQGKIHRTEEQPNRKLFLLGGIYLTVLVGAFIPSTFIAASPQEYIDLSYFHDPRWYIVSAVCLAAGIFIVWMGVFYWIADETWKKIFEKLMWILCGLTTINYMFFGTNLGVISSTLKYESDLRFTMKEQMINLLVLVGAVIVMYLFIKKWKQATGMVLLTLMIALSGMSVRNVMAVDRSVEVIEKQLEKDGDNLQPGFQLSRKGKNVMVILLDRAVGEYVPYLFQERPELERQFAGFTYYDNVISFGPFTNFGTPPLLGGYEYTPVEMNKRDTESLVSKHNESLKVMPKIFADHNYKVTLCDPPYANYQWIPDLSIFDDMPEVETHITKGKFNSMEQKKTVIANNRRNFFCFSAMKVMPISVQPLIYNSGNYHQVMASNVDEVYTTQTAVDMSQATGINANTMGAYNVLDNLEEMTTISKGKEDTFLFFYNDTTHEPMLFQEPEYKPAAVVDNREYDEAHKDRFTINGKTLKVEDVWQMSHYQTNMASFIKLGEYFDYLRQQGVYDNTKIILVADHGQKLGQLEELMIDNGLGDLEFYFPLLMVKDFDSEEFTTSHEFMTNADVPSLAMEGLIENPTNPFTGKAIDSKEKLAHEQYIIGSYEWDTTTNNGNMFVPGRWLSVREDIWNKNNWTIYDEEMVLKEHAIP